MANKCKTTSNGFIILLFIFLIFSGFMVFSQQKEKLTQVAQILTSKGEILIHLDDRTPNHKTSYIELAQSGYWDTLSFNRVIPKFVAQAGCPDTPAGFTNPNYLLEPEFNQDLKHIYGAVGAGRDDNPQKQSARCQFYIVHHPDGLQRLDGNYTVFGQVIKGMDVVDKIATAPRDANDEPLEAIMMEVNIIAIPQSEFETLIKKN